MSQQKEATVIHRKRYLPDQDSLPDVRAHGWAMSSLLKAKGFTPTTDKQGTIIDIAWPEERFDFALLDGVAGMIWAANNQTDEEYRESTLQEIEVYINANAQLRLVKDIKSIFIKLDDPTIPVSKAHSRTPMRHTLDVAHGIDTSVFRNQLTQTEALADWQNDAIFAARFQAFVHDWGKLFIADGDIYQYHAELSYLLFKKYVDSRVKRGLIHPNQADSLLQPIRYHHIFELVSKGVFDLEEVLELLVTDENAYILLGVLAAADAGSVEGYGHFALENVTTFFQGLERELAEVLARLPNFAHSLLRWFDGLLGSIEAYLGTNPGDKKMAQVNRVTEAEIDKLRTNAAFRVLVQNADITNMPHLSAKLGLAA
jgi:hypothetical protein